MKTHYGESHISKYTTYYWGQPDQYKVCTGCGLIIRKRISIKNLRNGALFVTKEGIKAIKSEYHYPNGNSQCVLLSNGEYAHFPKGDKTLVTQIEPFMEIEK